MGNNVNINVLQFVYFYTQEGTYGLSGMFGTKIKIFPLRTQQKGIK